MADDTQAVAPAERIQLRLARLLQAALRIQEARTEREVIEVVATAVRDTGWETVSAQVYEAWEAVDTVYVGLTEDEIAVLEANRPGPAERAARFGPDRERFKVSRSYLVPAEVRASLGLGDPPRRSRRERARGETWDPRDVAYVPMYGPDGEVIGSFAMDDPVDGQRPDEQTFQYLEFFSDLAAATVAKLRLAAGRAVAEAARQDSEQRARALADASFESIFFSARGICLDQNQTAERMFGYTREEAVGNPGTDWIAPQDRELVMDNMLAGREEPYEALAQRKDGSTFPAQIQARMINYRGRRIRVTSLSDVTVLKRAEEALRESKEKWRSVVENAPNLILILDRNGTIQFVNRPFCGHPASDVLGTAIAEYFPPADRDPLERNLAGVYRLGLTFRAELAGSGADGETIWYVCHAGPQRRGEEVVAVTMTAVDVTETKRLRELESRASRLEAAGRIAGQVAHDFNNLLGPLVGYPDLIRDLLPADHPALALIEEMERSSLQIAEINQQLLTLGRRGHYNHECLDLNRVVRDVIGKMQPLPGTVALRLDLAEDLMSITGGHAQLCRVVVNLLRNAVEAMQEVGALSIRTENRYVDERTTGYVSIPAGEYVELTIADTGCGIPDDALDRIFEPFYTSRSGGQRHGSGLGLSVVDGVVKDHDGHVDLHTRIGEGTTFRILFPITRETMTEEAAEETTGGAESILVIDDDDVQRRVSRSMLEKLGYDVRVAGSGEEALEVLRDDPRDLLILDMVMPPGIDGAETYRRVLELRSDQRAIIVSGYSETAQVLKAQQLGAGAFVRKPLTLEILARAVREELDGPARRVAPPVSAGLRQPSC